MSVTLKKMIAMLDSELTPEYFKDYCPNGLQVEGRSSVSKVVTGVSACQALIDYAVEQQADAILAHHGYFWRGENAVISGMKQRRIATLLKNNISLIVYHLPLDAHPQLGNNAQLAKLMGWSIKGGLEPTHNHSIGNWGETAQPLTVQAFSEQLEKTLKRPPLVIEGGSHLIQSIAWCTGAAQNMIDKALALGVDAFISGEISESTVHFARENGIHYFSAGHHATERYGVQALGEWLEKTSAIKHQFIDIDSPV